MQLSLLISAILVLVLVMIRLYVILIKEKTVEIKEKESFVSSIVFTIKSKRGLVSQFLPFDYYPTLVLTSLSLAFALLSYV